MFRFVRDRPWKGEGEEREVDASRGGESVRRRRRRRSSSSSSSAVILTCLCRKRLEKLERESKIKELQKSHDNLNAMKLAKK